MAGGRGMGVCSLIWFLIQMKVLWTDSIEVVQQSECAIPVYITKL